MGLPRLGRNEAAFIIGVPIAWGLLLLLHPGGEASDVYGALEDSVARGLIVHIGMLFFIPLMAVAVYLLLRGVEGRAAQVSRIGLVPFVVFYSAWETLQGIANAVLVNEVNGLSGAEQTLGAELVQDFAESPLVRDLGVLALIGTIGFVVATIAAGIALRRHAGASQSVAIMIGLSGFLITAHPPPFGPVGLALFAVAVYLFVRGQASNALPASLEQAGPA
jgi:hypothetical protein